MVRLSQIIQRTQYRLGYKTLTLGNNGTMTESTDSRKLVRAHKLLRKLRADWERVYRAELLQVVSSSLDKMRFKTQCPKCDYVRHLRFFGKVKVYNIDRQYRDCKYGCG